MLPSSHDRAYQDLLTLLTEFEQNLMSQELEQVQIKAKAGFNDFSAWFKQNILTLNDEGLDRQILPRWQAVQTEIKREFQLLSTDIIFFSSARQNATQIKRLETVREHLAKLINYCQIMLQDNLDTE